MSAEKRRTTIGNVYHMVRGPGGPFEKDDHTWARDMRRAGHSLKVIASYFEPPPSLAALRKVVGR